AKGPPGEYDERLVVRAELAVPAALGSQRCAECRRESLGVLGGRPKVNERPCPRLSRLDIARGRPGKLPHVEVDPVEGRPGTQALGEEYSVDLAHAASFAARLGRAPGGARSESRYPVDAAVG